MVLGMLLWGACGQVYRPVVIPCTNGNGVPGCPVEPPPVAGNFHAIFAISTNVANAPGGALQIDVSGDSIIAETSLVASTGEPNAGLNPTHAAVSANNSKLFVASASSVFAGGIDVIASFSPAIQSTIATGFGPVSTIPLVPQTVNITSISETGNVVSATLASPLLANPANSASGPIAVGTSIAIAGVVIPGCNSPCNPLAYNGTFTLASISGTTITFTNPAASGLAPASGGTAAVPPQPVFVNTTQTNAVYAANYNSNSVSAINTSTNSVSNSVTVGVHPVGLAETPNITANGGAKLYVANEGIGTTSSSVSSLNVADLSSNSVTGFTGINPVWVVARGDSQKVYVLTQGDGQLVTIDTATDTVSSSLAVGAGANFIFYDPHLNRLYVTNPVTGIVYVFSDTGGAGDTPILLSAISFNSGSIPCPAGCSPASVTALADGSRFYVASYQLTLSCPDPVIGTTLPCIVPGLTVFNANSMAVEYANAPTLTLLTWSPPCTPTPTNPCTETGPFATNQFAVPPVSSCGPVVPGISTPLYSPTTTRFRIFTTAAVDSSRVYVSMCDAGVVAVINTTDNNINDSGGGVPPDTLLTDLPAPFSNGLPQANGEPPNQNPIFMLTGQ
jgi:YVTN family beta-propeller protein